MADETKVGKVKRLLLERVTSILEDGVLAENDEGHTFVRAGSDKDLRLALDVVKTFHSEVGEQTDTKAKEVSAALARYRDRKVEGASAH